MECFVIMPFGDRTADPKRYEMLEHIYTEVIKPAVESVLLPGKNDKVKCHRADKDAVPGDILAHIAQKLLGADIVIADLSDRNTNVAYELGIRHVISDKTILIARDMGDVPSDLRNMRVIRYDYDPPGLARLRDEVRDMVARLLSLRTPERNAVRQAIYEREFEKFIGFDIAKSVLTEIGGLRDRLSAEMAELRDLVQTISHRTEPLAAAAAGRPPLAFMEGLWRSSPSRSLYCARIVNGVLLMPYCYGGEQELTGAYHSFRQISDRLFARFKWFQDPIAGYATYKIKDQDTLVGGWWYDRDVPSEFRRDYTRLAQYRDAMNETTWRRLKAQRFPDWAESFFDSYGKGGIRLE